jgi:methyl-accepting chemotaxis protein
VIYTGRTDEVGPLQHAKLKLQAKLRTVVGRIDETADTVANIAEQAAVTAEQTNHGVGRQQSETDQVATAVNEMSATVQEVAKNTHEAANAANVSNHEAAQGKAVVSNTMDAIDTLNSEVQRAAEVIQNLAADSVSISQVLEVISGITEQTNLLALNAAIDAARAGEAGRGFAVVADEVRTLASRTQSATLEIQQMIEKLQHGVSLAVDAMERGRNQVEVGVAKAAECGAALDRITEAVDRINDMNVQIASAAEEQTAVADEISQNIVHISTLADETAGGARQAAESSERLARAAGELNQLVQQFKVK